ncbi:CRISPR-associated helicase/endonuclease Cas3 [Aneurinibacillus terranovensis]|uniref:CRISPR-associated helicase/endonuclease Cas3 n=1 Tax=Aneurinibacillus terranovensis TaxID=278991 RepID=UPI0004041CCC|nr:CRISPR-associated helicase/endonuclease Cas3 [Aneurinibacillus terranovensis]
MEFYAKSSPVESIKEHTDELLKRLAAFKKIYQSSLPLLSERDWELLELAVKYHDVGKADTVFQNKIRNVIGEPLLPEASSNPIPHNLLSVMAIPFKLLGLGKDESMLVAQVVAYHHERGLLPDKQYIMSNYKENILPLKMEIEKQLGIIIDEKVLGSKISKIERRILPYDDMYFRYILLKGFLHRLDHAASAHVPIELAAEMDVGAHVNRFFERLKVDKKPLQIFTKSHQDHHLVVVAQTGMGKTEAGLFWLGNKKGFFTLPLRVSINAMYSRITKEDNIAFTKKQEELGEEATGLLHSTSLDYLYDQEEGNDGILEKVHSQSKEFANKLVISTIDQILKFPFYYLGFEKEYATMATSKVIIDELQAYDPKIAAVLIRAMTMIDAIGGSFMIMTATLPDFYFKALQRELSSSKKPLLYQEFIDDSVKRHNVVLKAQSILENPIVEEIVTNSASKKILVICNTVDRACKVYDCLHSLGAPVWLLHSRFTKRDRSRLEKQIIEFATNAECGVWVTTQLVEASLDIDFDMLYTEMSSLDSQFQRYGRCNRKGLKPVDKVNVYVLTEDVSGVNKTRGVYHPEIYERSLELLKKHSEGLLLESVKQEMIRELYDEKKLENSNFKNEFIQTLEELKNRPHYDPDFKKGKAQELLRDIHQVQAIPAVFIEQEEFQKSLAAWRNAQSKQEKRRYRNGIESYSVGVNKYRAEKVGLSEIEEIKGLFYIHCGYSSEKGLLLQSEDLFS